MEQNSIKSNIQWFPGHMAKTRRLIKENLKLVDIVIELLDARIPYSSKNPEIKKLTEGKPTLTLLNKASLADPDITSSWEREMSSDNCRAIAIDCINGTGISKIGTEIRNILSDKIKRYEDKGMSGRHIKAMIVGIPNVGKSSFVNKISGQKKAKAEDRPGVTMNKQWVATSAGFDLLDMPGVLWPKFEDETTGLLLAATGAIKDSILDIETLAARLAVQLLECACDKLCARYKLSPEEAVSLSQYELLELIGKKRGFLISGGEIDLERSANTLLDEFRGGKIGRITLERPSDIRCRNL